MAFVEPNSGDDQDQKDKVLPFESIEQDNKNLLKGHHEEVRSLSTFINVTNSSPFFFRS